MLQVIFLKFLFVNIILWLQLLSARYWTNSSLAEYSLLNATSALYIGWKIVMWVQGRFHLSTAVQEPFKFCFIEDEQQPTPKADFTYRHVPYTGIFVSMVWSSKFSTTDLTPLALSPTAHVNMCIISSI